MITPDDTPESAAGTRRPFVGVATGPGSTISSIFVLDTIVNEALKILAAEGCELPVFQSQNVDGFNNDAIYSKYEDRVKHF